MRTPSSRIALRRLNERAADIVIADNTEFERHAGFLGISDCRGHAGIRYRHHHVGRDMAFAGKFRTHGLADVINRSAADDRIGPREIDIFENAWPFRHRRERLVALVRRVRRKRSLRQVSTSRTYFAPMMSSAQVSDARIGQPSSSPSTSGRMPSGSRAPTNFLFVIADKRVGAFDGTQRLDETIDETVALATAATRCRMTSVSVVDCIMAPLRTSSRRSVSPLVRLPLWPTAKPPALSSANNGCTLRRIVSPVVE